MISILCDFSKLPIIASASVLFYFICNSDLFCGCLLIIQYLNNFVNYYFIISIWLADTVIFILTDYGYFNIEMHRKHKI